tara:strand:- start:759 stop:1499 length:741 start_codon:yes stop_codon:yes gene_type:complete
LKKIENQINKLIHEIEECADTFEKIKIDYGVKYIRDNDSENNDTNLSLTSVIEAPPEYEVDKEVVWLDYYDSKDKTYQKYLDGEITEDVYKDQKSIFKKELAMNLGEIELKYSDAEKNKDQRFEEDYLVDKKRDFIHSYTDKTTELLFATFKELKEQAKFLISLLDKHKQIELTKRVDAVEIEKIQAKRYITVKEFTEIFNKGEQWQRDRRDNRIHNKLPTFPKDRKKGDEILYELEEVIIWFENE